MEQKYFNACPEQGRSELCSPEHPWSARRECVDFTLKVRKINASSLEEAGMRVFKNQTMNTETVFAALGKGGIIMPVLKGQFVGSDEKEVMCVLVSADHLRKQVTLYIPTINDTKTFDRDAFMAAWNENSGKCDKAFPKDKDTYIPNLTNLDDIDLPDDLDDLCEKIAEHAHDVWATERQSQGWTYGLKRDDSKLITPDMVPYSQLPEAEKEYDRIMAMGTLKLLASLGYKVVKE